MTIRCKVCGSKRGTVKGINFLEYSDAAIPFKATFEEDGTVEIDFQIEGSWYVSEYEDEEETKTLVFVCENKHKTELREMKEKETDKIYDAMSIQSVTHHYEKKLQMRR